MAQTIPVQFSGSRSFLGLATETVYGDGATATDFVEVDDGLQGETDPGNLPVETIRNTRAKISHFIQGPTWSEGSWSQPLFPNQGIRALAAALGSDAITGAGPTYTHTLTRREDGLPSLSLEVGGATVNPSGTPTILASRTYAGCLIDEVKMSGATGAPLKMDYKFVGQPEGSLGSPSTPSWIGDTPYALGDVTTFTVFSVTLGLLTVTAFEWTLKNAAKREFGYNGARSPALVYGGDSMIEGKLTILVQDWSWATDAAAGTLGDIVIGATQSTPSSVTATLKNVVFGKPSKPLKLGTQRVIELPFTGSLKIGAAYDIQVVVVNAKSSAYV